MLDASPRLRRLILAALLATSLALQLRLLRRGLPTAVNIDEPSFIVPAIQMVQNHDANPHWLGHPASTTIYPLAVVLALRGSAAVTTTLARQPEQLAYLARLLSIFAAVGGLALSYLLARRIFDDLTGLVALALLVPSQWLISLTTLARSDGASLLFGAWALDRLFRAHQEPSTKNHLWAGIAVGLAVATKYYFAVFGVVVAIWAVGELRRPRAQRLPLSTIAGRTALAAGMSLVTFAAATPFFFLDWSQALHDFRSESTELCCGITAPSAWQALTWHLSSGLSTVWRWPMLGALAAGVVLVLVRRQRLPLVAITTAAVFLLAISLVRHRVDRWLLPILPLLVAVSAHAVVSAARAGATRLKRDRLSLPVAVLLTAAVAPSWREVMFQRSGPGTFGHVRSWIYDNLPSGSTIAYENDGWTWTARLTGPLQGTRLKLERGAWSMTVQEILGQLFDHHRDVNAWRCQGVDFLVINWWNTKAYPNPLYDEIEKLGRLVAAWQIRGGGTQQRIFDIRDLACK